MVKSKKVFMWEKNKKQHIKKSSMNLKRKKRKMNKFMKIIMNFQHTIKWVKKTQKKTKK